MVEMTLAEDDEGINADGLRFTGNTGAVKYIWNGQTLVAETNNINTVSTWYTQGPTSEFGELISRFSGVSSYPLMDAPGTVDRLTAQNQSASSRGVYDAFGKLVVTGVSGSSQLAYVAREGYYYDVTVGMYYIRQRWYDPGARQFVSPDFLGIGGGDANLYRYVGNNPVNAKDPAGLASDPGLARVVDPNCKDTCGPDVTEWFYSDLLSHIKIAKDNSELYFASRRQGHFMTQAKYWLAYKWMSFKAKGCATGNCANTVTLAGMCIRKNQLGNIAFMVIGHLYPPGGDFASPASIAAVGYSLGSQYDRKHPHAGNYGAIAGQPRSDNLAAFGVGDALASANAFGSLAAFIAQLTKSMSSPVDLNIYAGLYPRNSTFTSSTLTFVSEFRGFNTQNCKPCGQTFDPKSIGSKDWFVAESTRIHSLPHEPTLELSVSGPVNSYLDNYLRQHYEDYAH